MPRTSGTYTLPPVYLGVSGQKIRTEQHNTPFEDVAAALTNSLPRDGQAGMTGSLPMGGNKITGLGAGTDPGDAARVGQAAPRSDWLTAVSALTLAPTEMVYATSPTVAAKVATAAYGRGLLALTSAQALRDAAEVSGFIGPTALSAGTTIVGAIPSGIRELEIILSGATISTSSSTMYVRVGFGAFPESSGYLADSSNGSSTLPTSAIGLVMNTLTNYTQVSGSMRLVRLTDAASSVWTSSHVLRASPNAVITGAGITPAGVDLDRLSISCSGSGTFTNGFISLRWKK